MENDKLSKTGWWNPSPFSMQRKVTFHYVTADGRTLCCRWAYMGEGLVEEGKDDHKENCKTCVKKKQSLDRKSKKET